MNLLLINNYDSFVYNLAQLVEETHLCQLEVLPYDQVNETVIRSFDRLILSPGPGIPPDFPKLQEYVRLFYREKDILGICLGFEAIALAFGGEIHHSGKVFHGIVKNTLIQPPVHPVFKNIPQQFDAGLYHSWILKKESFPGELTITAEAEDGVIMALGHPEYNLVGFQYHPESIMTPMGRQMIMNWLTSHS